MQQAEEMERWRVFSNTTLGMFHSGRSDRDRLGRAAGTPDSRPDLRRGHTNTPCSARPDAYAAMPAARSQRCGPVPVSNSPQ